MNPKHDSADSGSTGDEAQGHPRLRGCLIKSILGGGSLLLVIALLLPAVRRAGPSALRVECLSHIREVGLAIRQYHDNTGTFPPAYTVDAQGNRLHSWRTLILPYLDNTKLYRSIDLSKPWDDPANLKAFNQVTPSVFRCSSAQLPNGSTTYMAVVASDGCFSGATPQKLADITDDHGSTLLIIEATSDRAAPWMSPADVDEAWLMQVGPKTKTAHPGLLQAVFVDGHGESLELNLPVARKRALISIAGGDDGETRAVVP